MRVLNARAPCANETKTRLCRVSPTCRLRVGCVLSAFQSRSIACHLRSKRVRVERVPYIIRDTRRLEVCARVYNIGVRVSN